MTEDAADAPWQTRVVRFAQKIQQYLGLDRPPVLEQYRTSQRNAYLICTTCRAFVDAEGQELHTDWHRTTAT